MNQIGFNGIEQVAKIFNIDIEILEKEETLSGLSLAIFDILFLKHDKKNKSNVVEKLLQRHGYNAAIADYILNAVRKIHKEKKLYPDFKKSTLSLFLSSELDLQRFITEILMNLSLKKNGNQIFSSDNLVIERDWIEQTSLQRISDIAIAINTSASFGINLLNHNCYVRDKQLERVDIARFDKKAEKEFSLLFTLKVKDSNEVFIGLHFSEELSIKENVSGLNFHYDKISEDKIKEELVEVLSKTFIIYNDVFFDFFD